MNSKNVKIVEVGPRDGLQNESMILPIDVKFQFIQDLIIAGLSHLEVTSFVRADKIPQMADAVELFKLVHDKYRTNKDLSFYALVPNLKGLDAAIESGVKEIAVFTSTSDTFNIKNINSDVKESLTRIIPVIKEAKKNGVKVRGYISTVFGCPYEGETSIDTLKNVAEELLNAGASELSLGDTIGIGNPMQVENIIGSITSNIDLDKVAMHFHDTRGLAIANIYTSYQNGIRIFDSSAGGLGGCPYAKGATGNVATEDVVNLFNTMDVLTGVDLNNLIIASTKILTFLKKDSPSKYYQYDKRTNERP